MQLKHIKRHILEWGIVPHFYANYNKRVIFSNK